jgi:hypothetical protein
MIFSFVVDDDESVRSQERFGGLDHLADAIDPRLEVSWLDENDSGVIGVFTDDPCAYS